VALTPRVNPFAADAPKVVCSELPSVAGMCESPANAVFRSSSTHRYAAEKL